MKVVKFLVVFLFVFLLSSWAIGAYLGPDDLKDCGARPDPSKQGCFAADAIVAVSGGDTKARVDEAVKLYQNGWAPLLIFSGAAADTSGPSNAEVMKQRAVDAGVNAKAIIIEPESQNTSENASETASIFEQQNVKSAIIVTSAYHERRASLEFARRAGGVSVRRHPVVEDLHWSQWWWLTPRGWSLAITELVGTLIVLAGGSGR